MGTPYVHCTGLSGGGLTVRDNALCHEAKLDVDVHGDSSYRGYFMHVLLHGITRYPSRSALHRLNIVGHNTVYMSSMITTTIQWTIVNTHLPLLPLAHVDMVQGGPETVCIGSVWISIIERMISYHTLDNRYPNRCIQFSGQPSIFDYCISLLYTIVKYWGINSILVGPIVANPV